MQPAIVPNFGTLKTSRTSATPMPHFLERRLEQAGHRLLHLVGDVVDDRVQADVDLRALGDVGGVAIGPHVEADDDRVRRRREQHVGLVDGADAGVDDPDLDLLVGQLGERVGQHFGRALHVGLDDDRQLLHAAFGDLLLQRFEREPAALGAERALLRLRLAERGDLPRLAASATLERIAGLRQAARPSTSTGVDGPADLTACRDRRSARGPADDRAGDEVVADAQRAVLHEDGRHRAAAAIELRFEHGARRACASGWP
jgi:hypothetical protein